MSHDKEEQINLFNKVIDFKQSSSAKKGQQRLFERKEKLSFKEMLDDGLSNMQNMLNEKLSNSAKENKDLKDKVDRLANGLDRMVSKFEDMSVGGEKPDLVVNPYSDQYADLTLTDSCLPAEAVYTLNSTAICNSIGNKSLHPSVLGKILTLLKIKGDPKFHHSFKTGNSASSKVPRYKPQVVYEIYKRLEEYEKYGLTLEEKNKFSHYFKDRGLLVK